MIQPAFAAPDRSRRRKISAKTVMKIQIAMNQKKKTIMAQMTLPNDHSVDSIGAPPCSPLTNFRAP